MKSRLLIIGASGHGKVVAEIAIRMGFWNSVAFLDDNEELLYSLSLDVIGRSSDFLDFIEDSDFFVAVGNNEIRERIQLELEEAGASIVSLIHPSAIIASEVEIGSGTVVMAGVVVNCSTKVGRGCILNSCCCVDHDNVIGDFVHVSPGVCLAGSVSVGSGTWLGIGSVVINNVSVCGSCVVGAGGVVIGNIVEPGTYVGVPVRKLN